MNRWMYYWMDGGILSTFLIMSITIYTEFRYFVPVD